MHQRSSNPSRPQLLHESPRHRHLVQVRLRLPPRHVPVLRDDVLQRAIHVRPHLHRPTDEYRRPLVVHHPPRLPPPPSQQVLHVNLALLLPRERQVELGQRPLLRERLQLVAVDVIHRSALAAEVQHARAVIDAVPAPVGPFLEHGAHGRDARAGTEHDHGTLDLFREAERRVPHEGADGIADVQSREVAGTQPSERLPVLLRRLQHGEGDVNRRWVHRGARGDGVVPRLQPRAHHDKVLQGTRDRGTKSRDDVREAHVRLHDLFLVLCLPLLGRHPQQRPPVELVARVGRELLQVRTAGRADQVAVPLEARPHGARPGEGEGVFGVALLRFGIGAEREPPVEVVVERPRHGLDRRRVVLGEYSQVVGRLVLQHTHVF
mmetsp:Transcript_46780/g.99282  ORF Transcript_46780/g.99282 Transcript_46780/m.99282 type:complete len:378 (+) Transcript_46780:134-1267(+)